MQILSTLLPEEEGMFKIIAENDEKIKTPNL